MMTDDGLMAVASLLQHLARKHGTPEPHLAGPADWDAKPELGELVGCHVSFDPHEVYKDTRVKVWRDGDERLHVECQWPHLEGDGA